jgi:hypothetical protein
MKWLIVLAACFAAVASAADISGNWKGTAENQGQSIQRTFTFKVDGAKLTGETNSEMLGKSTLNDGKVDRNGWRPGSKHRMDLEEGFLNRANIHNSERGAPRASRKTGGGVRPVRIHDGEPVSGPPGMLLSNSGVLC